MQVCPNVPQFYTNDNNFQITTDIFKFCVEF